MFKHDNGINYIDILVKQDNILLKKLIYYTEIVPILKKLLK